MELLGHMVVLFVFEEPPYCFPQWLYQFTSPQKMYKGSLFSTSSPAFVICGLSQMILINPKSNEKMHYFGRRIKRRGMTFHLSLSIMKKTYMVKNT